MQFRLPLALSLLAATTLPAQQDASRRSLPVADLLAPLIQESWLGPVPFWTQLHDDRGHRMGGLTFLGDTRGGSKAPRIAPDTLTYLASKALSTETQQVPCRIIGGHMVFAAGDATMQKAQELLTDLRQRVLAPISIEIALFRSNNAVTKGFQWLSQDQARQWMERLQDKDRARLILHQQGRLVSGDRIYLGERRMRNYHADYNIEIAQSSMAVDPVVSTFEYGRGMSIRAESSPDGQSLALHFEIALRTVPKRVGRIQVGYKEISSLDRLEFETRNFIGSVTSPNRAAFVFAPGGESGAGLRALVMVDRAVTDAPAQSRFRLLARGQLTSWLARTHIPEFETTILPIPMKKKELMEDLLAARSDSSGMSASIPVMDDHHMLLQGTPIALQPILDRIDKISAERSRNYLVRIGHEMQGEDGTWKPIHDDLVLPILAWRSSAIVLGRGQTYLADFNSEVAQKARGMDPEINHMFEGTIAHISLLPMGEKLLLQLDFESSQLDELRSIELVGKDKGVLEAPSIRRIQWSRQLDLIPGQKLRLGQGLDETRDGKSQRTRLWIQVDKLPPPGELPTSR